MNFSFNKLTIIFALLSGQALFPICSNAQSPVFTQYTVKEGLPSNKVYFAMQDSKGYMWFGTEAGVSRFDGIKFKNFTIDNGLSDNEVFKIHEDSRGRLWFLTYSGIPTIYENGIFRSTLNYPGLCDIPFDGYLSKFHEDDNGNIWLGGLSAQIVKIAKDLASYEFIELPCPSLAFNVKATGSISIYCGNLKENIIHEVTILEDSLVTKEFQSPSPFLQNSIHSIAPFAKDPIIASSFGLFKVGAREITQFIDINDYYEKGGRIVSLSSDREGAFWVGTPKGVVKLKTGGDQTLASSRFLSGNLTTSVFQDREFNFWFTTNQGIFFSPNIEITNYSSSEDLNADEILSLAPIQGNMVIAGAKNDGYYIFQEDQIKFNSLTAMNGFPAEILSIYSNDDYILLGGIMGLAHIPMANGVLRSDRTKHHFKESVNKGVPFSKFSNIVKYENGLRISTTHGPILLTESQLASEHLEDQSILEQMGSHLERITAQWVDRNDTLWFTNPNGLFKTYKNTTTPVTEVNHRLAGARVTSIKEGKSGDLWLGTSGKGVFVWKRNKLIQITVQDGLASNICNKLFLVGETVWVATNNGLSKLMPNAESHSSFEILNYTSKDGLLGNKINDVTKFKEAIWIASAQGISVFREDQFNQIATPPLIHIEKFVVNETILPTDLSYHLEPDQNSVLIKFTGLSFKSQGEVSYAYKLIGQDSSWKTTHSNSIEYASLPPGEYIFEVHARDYRNIQSEDAARISFTIATPWSETLWAKVLFQVLIVMSIILLGMSGFWIYRRRQHTKNQLILSEQKALRAQMNPHFIFNSLSSIQSFIIGNQKETAIDYLSDFGALIRGILQNSQSSTVSLEEELNMLRKYLTLEQLRADNKFQYEIILDPEIDLFDTMIPTMLIQPFLENAIWHGVMQKESNGNIKLELKQYDQGILCVVEDDGVGREATTKSQRPKKHRSMGMAITKERLDLLNRGNKLKLHSRIMDLKNSEDKPTGTRVEIFIPVQQQA